MDDDCKALLDKIEASNYSLPLEAHGVVGTRNLVSVTSDLTGTCPHAFQLRDLNALGRLCRSMGVPFSLLRLDWPSVSVEFRWLIGATENWEVSPASVELEPKLMVFYQFLNVPVCLRLSTVGMN